MTFVTFAFFVFFVVRSYLFVDSPRDRRRTKDWKEDAPMKVLKPDEIPAESANSPLFTGGPVTRQPLLTPEMSNDFNLSVVNFSAGARN